MRIETALKIGEKKLASAKIENAKREALWILSSLLGFTQKPLELYLKRDQLIHPKILQQYQRLLSRRAKGVPLAYILGFQEFFGLEFIVNRDVFIPRPETELLVEEVLKLFSHFSLSKVGTFKSGSLQGKESRILDIGTGSGNIAISLAKHCSSAKIVATDISIKALKVARKNAVVHRVAERITFVHSDLFPPPSPAPQQNPTFDLIVSNPPYVKSKEIKTLQKEIQLEPKIALDGGEDGFKFVKKIILRAKSYLKKNGMLYLEIGYNQIENARRLMHQAGYCQINSLQDLSGFHRVVMGKSG